MGRKLPRAKKRDPEAVHKRRLQVMKRFYQAYYEWQALRVAGLTEIDVFVSPDGEEIYMPDLMTGYNFLPRRQRQSFELICLRSYTEAEATAVILPGSKWSTPVQQYAADALERMVEAYDAKQSGTWDPVAVAATRKLGDMITELSTAEAALLASRNRARGTVDDDAIRRPGRDANAASAPVRAELEAGEQGGRVARPAQVPGHHPG